MNSQKHREFTCSRLVHVSELDSPMGNHELPCRLQSRNSDSEWLDDPNHGFLMLVRIRFGHRQTMSAAALATP
ncbi:MAG: hypothetical protein R3C59_04635 [Planctomycetaceae bacterium]